MRAWWRAWRRAALGAASGSFFCVGALVAAGLPELRVTGLLLAGLGVMGMLYILSGLVRGPGEDGP